MVGRWFVGLVLRFVTPKKLLPVSWQVAQPEVMPAWFITPDLNELVSAWHSVHAAVVGTWFAGLPPVTPVAKDTVDVWQAAQSAVVGMCPVPCGFGVTPVKTIPVALAAWHVVQAPAMPV